MRQPLLDAVKGLDPAAGQPDIDGEAMLARIRAQAKRRGGGDVAHLVPRQRSRPARRLAMGAAALSAVVAVALVLTLTQGGSQAYASWVAQPTSLAPTEAAAGCPDVEFGPPEIPVNPVLGEQRGAYRYSVLVGDGAFVECLANDSGDEPWLVAQGVTPADPAVVELGEAPVSVLIPGVAWADEGSEGPITTVVGIAADDVTGVRLTTVDGVTAQASLGNGWWAVWFPGEVELSDDLVVITPDGESTLSLEALIAEGI